MTPAARISAAIGLMDRILSGELADRALADWGRKNRYAGSKDRAAIADLVYDVLRRKRSLASRGGGDTGRALLLGYVREARQDPETIFGVGPYAPSSLTEAERLLGRPPRPNGGESVDFPEWLWPHLQDSLGEKAQTVADAMRNRAPVYLRVNLSKLSRERATAELADEGITVQPHVLSPSALEVTDGARKVRNSQAYLQGKIELQDVSSQAVADLVPLKSGGTLLDFCAGGGGKVLAVAGRVAGKFYAHDADPGRLKDLPKRASRAGVAVSLVSLPELGKQPSFDSVLIDVPCSGTGSWRRDPQGKWLLTPDKLRQTLNTQKEILSQATRFVKPLGHLIYATCSLLECENGQQISEFVKPNSNFSLVSERRFTPLDGGDGFYCAVLRKD